MSTLKVDTIQPNASDRLFVSSTLEVDGSQLLVNNALNVGGNASITGSLSAATLTSNGTITANGNVTGVSDLSCATITASGSVSSASISSGTGAFTGAVTSDSKNLFRPPVCGTLRVGNTSASPPSVPSFNSNAVGSGPANARWPQSGYSFANNASLSLATTVGGPSASWVTVNTYNVARITWGGGIISNNYARIVTAIFKADLSTYNVCGAQPIYTWGSTNLDIYGFAGELPPGTSEIRFHFWIDFPNTYS